MPFGSVYCLNFGFSPCHLRFAELDVQVSTCQVFVGLSLRLMPRGFLSSTCLAMFGCCLHRVWPIHLHFFCKMAPVYGYCPVFVHSARLERKVNTVCVWQNPKNTFILNVSCVLVFCVIMCRSVCLFLYGSFCHGVLKLDMSTLFTTFFLWTSLIYIVRIFFK